MRTRNRVLAGLIFAIGAGANKLIGDAVGGGFLWIVPRLDDLLKASVPLPIWLVVVVFLCLLAGAWFVHALLSMKVRNSERQALTRIETQREELVSLESAIRLVRMDDSLLRGLPLLGAAPDIQEALKQLLREFVRDATDVFEGSVSRGAIFSEQDNMLVPLVGFQIPPETMQRTQFSIPPSRKNPKGTACKTFCDRKLRVVHLEQDKKTKKWRADDSAYIIFDSQRPHPPYKSFVTVAIVGSREESIGVLSFDSPNIDTFDPPEIRSLLVSIAARISSAMELCNQIESTRST